MKSYNYIVVILYKLFFFYFILLQAFDQENDGDIKSPPQNIVPEISEDEIKDNEEANTNILNEVTIDDLPNNKPSWIGNLSVEDGGLGWNMWEGTDAAFAKILLEELPVSAPSPAMRNLAKRLLISEAYQPNKKEEEGLRAISPNGQPLEILEQDGKFLSLRFSKLASLGAKSELYELSKSVAIEEMVGELAKESIYARLLSGETDKVCNEVIEFSKRTNETYWRKALIVCQLILGERDAALLSLELLLAELNSEDNFSELIYALADESSQIEFDEKSIYFKILIAVLPGEQLDKHRLNLEPAGLSVVAQNTNLSWDIRMLAAEKAVLAGSLSSIYLGDLASQHKFNEDIFARAASESNSMKGFKARTLLLQAAARNTSFIERARFLRLLLDSADKEMIFQVYAAVSMPILLTIKPRPDLIWFASSAARAAIAGGNYELASESVSYTHLTLPTICSV